MVVILCSWRNCDWSGGVLRVWCNRTNYSFYDQKIVCLERIREELKLERPVYVDAVALLVLALGLRWLRQATRVEQTKVVRVGGVVA